MLAVAVEESNGPNYGHLGHASTREGLEARLLERLGLKPKELRLVAAVYTKEEAATPDGCPIAREVRVDVCRI